MRSAVFLVLAMAASPLGALTACSAAVSCRVGADCASGLCKSDGTCAIPPDAGPAGGGSAGGGSTGGGSAGGGSTGGGSTGGSSTGGSSTGGSSTGGSSTGGSSTGGSSTGGSSTGGAGAGTCLPNNDGVITRAEVPLAAGLHATYLEADNAMFDTTGVATDAGFLWDLSVSLNGDHSVRVDTSPMAGAWFESFYSGASYYSPLSDSLYGVFELTPDALLLLGTVSTADSSTATELLYTPPAKLMAFPMSLGSTWSSTSTITGRYNGFAVSWTQTETYESSVDKSGLVLTPFSPFPVLRISTVLTRTISATTTTSRSLLFTTECFGTVATLSSQLGETQTEFSSELEVQRLSP